MILKVFSNPNDSMCNMCDRPGITKNNQHSSTTHHLESSVFLNKGRKDFLPSCSLHLQGLLQLFKTIGLCTEVPCKIKCEAWICSQMVMYVLLHDSSVKLDFYSTWYFFKALKSHAWYVLPLVQRFFPAFHPEALLIGISSWPASSLPCFHSHTCKTEKIHTEHRKRIPMQNVQTVFSAKKKTPPKSSLLSQLSTTDLSPVYSPHLTHQRNRADEQKCPHIVHQADSKHRSTRGVRKHIDFSPEGDLPWSLKGSPQPTWSFHLLPAHKKFKH